MSKVIDLDLRRLSNAELEARYTAAFTHWQYCEAADRGYDYLEASKALSLCLKYEYEITRRKLEKPVLPTIGEGKL